MAKVSQCKKSVIIILIFYCFILIFLSACTDKDLERSIESVVEISILDEKNEVLTQGTGFCVKRNNLILTVAHLFDQFQNISYRIIATTLNGEKYDLDLVSKDSEKDIAILEICNATLKPLEIAISRPKNLDTVYTIGNTRGYGLAFNKGIVSMTEKSLKINGQIKKVMQTNLTINPGDSGAPVFNEKKQIVGMMSFKLTDGNGIGVDGVSFSVLLEDIIDFLEKV